LVDGRIVGTWKIERTKKITRVLVNPFVRLTKITQQALAKEGESLARFIEPDTEGVEIKFT
jgi:Winged helix DNA-binding domain